MPRKSADSKQLHLVFPESSRYSFSCSSNFLEGSLQQYAGRLHRIYDLKNEVQIYDYVDDHVPMLSRMYQKRLKGYQAIGYTERNS